MLMFKIMKHVVDEDVKGMVSVVLQHETLNWYLMNLNIVLSPSMMQPKTLLLSTTTKFI